MTASAAFAVLVLLLMIAVVQADRVPLTPSTRTAAARAPLPHRSGMLRRRFLGDSLVVIVFPPRYRCPRPAGRAYGGERRPRGVMTRYPEVCDQRVLKEDQSPYQPRSARRCGCGMSSTLMPTMAS